MQLTKNRVSWSNWLSRPPPLAQLLSAQAIGAGGLGFDFRAGQIGIESPTARHRSDVSLDLCSQGAMP